MSKVISFSISDRYLDKIRSLYPHLTDNLAAKQALIDRLDDKLDAKLDDGIKTLIESSLSSSLDDSLDGILDDKLKSLIETSLDGILDERLDDAVKKSIGELTERLSRLESRLDDRLDDGLNDMEPLLKLQREASIANPPIEETVETAETVETDLLFKLALKLDRLDDQALIDAIESQLKDDDNEENYSRIETALEALGTVTGETSPTIETGEGMNAAQAYRYLAQKEVKISERTLSSWVKSKGIAMTNKGDKVSEYLILRDKLYYPIN